MDLAERFELVCGKTPRTAKQQCGKSIKDSGKVYHSAPLGCGKIQAASAASLSLHILLYYLSAVISHRNMVDCIRILHLPGQVNVYVVRLEMV
jgi:hypothetical protein